MGRTDFDRIPFARQPYELDEIIPSIPEGVSYDDNSPLSDTEVRFNDDDNARRRSICIDWHNNMGERELEIVAGYNSVRRERLNEALKEKMAVHGPVKTLAVTMATQNARAHAPFFIQHGFTRAVDRSRTTWTYVADIEEQKLRKKERSRAKLVDVKPEPKPDPKTELKPLMTLSEYQNRTAELDALRSRIKKLEDGGAT